MSGERLRDKVVLITGVASGIGRATALRLASEGARLFATDVAATGLEETAKAIREAGGTVETRVQDVSDAEQCREVVAACATHYGRIDVLCNVAGILHFSHTHEHGDEDWRRILAVNLDGTFYMCRAALPHLLESRGNIVNMASTAALSGHPWTAAYSASKGGVRALTLTLAIEYAEAGLRANCVCPGSIETPIQAAFKLPDGANPKLLRRIMPPDRVFRGPEAVAGVIAMLASDDGAHINGESIRVDGGTLS